MLSVFDVGYSIFSFQTSRKAAFFGVNPKKHSVLKIEFVYFLAEL